MLDKFSPSEQTDENHRLDGQAAIVTGASRGIGRQIALAFGRRGASVVVAARTVEQHGRLPGTIGETVAAIEGVGATAFAVAADMADQHDLDRLIASAVERFGRIDILVNNAAATAGKAWGAPLAALTREEWMSQYAVNLHAPFSLIRAAAPVMHSVGGGRVINLTTAGHRGEQAPVTGLPVPLAYPSSKAALDQFCRSVAPQLREVGVSIVNVHPGFVRTELVEVMAARGMDDSAAIPMDIPTRAITYLASCPDPMRFTGLVLSAEDIVDSLGAVAS